MNKFFKELYNKPLHMLLVVCVALCILTLVVEFFIYLFRKERMKSRYLENPLSREDEEDEELPFKRLREEKIQRHENVRSNKYHSHEFLPDEYKAGVYTLKKK